MALSEPCSPYVGPTDPVESSKIWHRFSKWLGRDESLEPIPDSKTDHHTKPSLARRMSRKVVPGLPRPATFRRQNSEKRDRLLAVDQSGDERRAQSLDRRRARSIVPMSSTVPDLAQYPVPDALYRTSSGQEQAPNSDSQHDSSKFGNFVRALRRPTAPDRPISPERPPSPPPEDETVLRLRAKAEKEQILKELEEKWILNLSMHFRDNSPREKFFVTFAESPTNWRRVTVSCDYRNAPLDSLEHDLQELPYQREKNARIYAAIRDSIPDIKFFDTVTNLKLETDEHDRLHVHVTEDHNERIPYPSTAAVRHLDYHRVNERDVQFDSHMSGFVYKVRVNNGTFNGKVCVKKEIPGPDSVEEFLYEINALHALAGTSNVIQFEGLVIDDENDLVKGLLISYAKEGPLVDLIYDFRDHGSLTWERKEKWTRQIIYGLSEIHEAGFVQGDCTLSNIVIDEHDDAMIIDINRRGCPVGWEPPEINRMLDNGHRISMYIGVKSDLFQLGMTLWALFMEEDEPERQTRPLTWDPRRQVPKQLQEIANICMSEKPKDRLSAARLLSLFPTQNDGVGSNAIHANEYITALAPADMHTVYIDPTTDMEQEYSQKHFHHARGRSVSSDRSWVSRRYESPDSQESRRGRTPVRNSNHSDEDMVHIVSSSDGRLEPQYLSTIPSHEPKWTDSLDVLDSGEDENEAAQRRIRRRQGMSNMDRSPAPMGLPNNHVDSFPRTFKHIDSGLADMDKPAAPHTGLPPNRMDSFPRRFNHVDSGLADMDLDQHYNGYDGPHSSNVTHKSPLHNHQDHIDNVEEKT